jgi:uncharacterized protein
MTESVAADTSRFGVLDRGSTILVMDRQTGRSIFMPRESAPMLRLLASAPDELPDALRPVREQVLDELAGHGIGIEPKPRVGSLNTLILKLTTACNYACTYCYDDDAEAPANLGDDVALRALEQALELCDGALQVIFHGGEPFLRFARIKEIVLAGEQMAYRLGKGLFFRGQTNLSLLSRETIGFSDEHRIRWGFSLDGTAETNRLRTLKNGTATHANFERALASFPEFVRSCGVMATITAANQSRLLELSHYFRSCGLHGWDWSLFQPIGRGRRSEEFDVDLDLLIPSWNELFDAVVEGQFDGFTVSPVLKYAQNFLEGPGHDMCMRRDCGAARDLMSISADGRIEACDCIDPRGPLANLGDVRETTLRAARDSEVARTIRSRDVALGKCGTCIWLAVCGGSCLARSPGLHGVDEIECQLSLNAFERISSHLAESSRLAQYFRSCNGYRAGG